MTQIVPVNLDGHSYDIMIASKLLSSAGSVLRPYLNGRRPIIVTDENVARFQLPALAAALGTDIETIILPAGEATKSWAGLSELCDRLLSIGVERGDHIIAFGGGVIGDLTGFAASIIKRGCHFIQIPTTLLAQVDSSVGGKTAINTGAGKNLVGHFHQPSLVLIDPDVLKTLPKRDMLSGYAEVVKYGLIGDPAFFEWCEAHAANVIDCDPSATCHAIETSVKAKAHIVAADERETKGVRALLNLGHTFGHALEAETGYSERLLHGEAVAAGMTLAFRFSVHVGLCDRADSTRVDAHLAAVGLPNSLAAAGIRTNGAALVAHMAHDKKMANGTLPFILTRGIGQAFVDNSVDLDQIEAFLDGEARASNPDR